MGRNSIYCVDTRLNYLNPTLSQHWIILLPMLSQMSGWKLKMISICSIVWRAISVYLRFYLIRKYRIIWFCTCKFRLVHAIRVASLWSWKNCGLKNIWRPFSFFNPIKCIVVVTSQRRWRMNSQSASTAWSRGTRSIERMIYTPRIMNMGRCR